MKALFPVVIGLVTLGAAVSPEHSARSKHFFGHGCYASDSVADRFLEYYVDQATETDTVIVRLRTEDSLFSATANQIALVSDSTKCARAAAAYTAEIGDSNANRKVYLISYSTTRYVAMDTLLGDKGPSVDMVFDTAFTLKRRLLR